MESLSYIVMVGGGLAVALAVVVGRSVARRIGGSRGWVAGAATAVVVTSVALAVGVRTSGERVPTPVLADVQPLGISFEPADAFEILPPPTGDGPSTVRARGTESPVLLIGTVPYPYRGAPSEALYAAGLRAAGGELASEGFVAAPLPFASSARGIAVTMPDRSAFGWLVARGPDATTTFLCLAPASADGRIACGSMLAAIELETPFRPAYR